MLDISWGNNVKRGGIGILILATEPQEKQWFSPGHRHRQISLAKDKHQSILNDYVIIVNEPVNIHETHSNCRRGHIFFSLQCERSKIYNKHINEGIAWLSLSILSSGFFYCSLFHIAQCGIILNQESNHQCLCLCIPMSS